MKKKVIDCTKKRREHICSKNVDRDGYCTKCGTYVGLPN